MDAACRSLSWAANLTQGAAINTAALVVLTAEMSVLLAVNILSTPARATTAVLVALFGTALLLPAMLLVLARIERR